MSIHPSVQEAQSSSGLLQAACISLYTSYLTWSAISNEPDAMCNPGFVIFHGFYFFMILKFQQKPTKKIAKMQNMSQNVSSQS